MLQIRGPVGLVMKNAHVAWNVYYFTANRSVSSRLAISGLSTSPNFRFLGQVQKFHCSLVDQRKGCFKVRLATRREILWWKICAELARKSGRLSTSKLLILNKLTAWRWVQSPANPSLANSLLTGKNTGKFTNSAKESAGGFLYSAESRRVLALHTRF